MQVYRWAWNSSGCTNAPFAQLGHRDAVAHKRQVVLDLVQGVPVRAASGARSAGPGRRRTFWRCRRNTRTGRTMSVSNPTRSPASMRRSDASWNHGLIRFPGGEHAPLVPVAVVREVRVVQQRPELDLRHPGPGRLLHLPDSEVGDRDRPLHARDLVRRLDDARLLDQVRSVDDVEAGAHQGLRHARIDVLDGHPAVVGPDLVQERPDVAGQRVRHGRPCRDRPGSRRWPARGESRRREAAALPARRAAPPGRRRRRTGRWPGCGRLNRAYAR